jgi:peptidoglycan hydrolase-like protein with peptidoglycan-binding domain
MKTLLSEIKKIKKMLKLNEDFGDVRVVLIGDGLIYYLKDNELQEIPELVGEDFTIKKLLKELLSVDEFPDVDHVFVSIGLNDEFKDKKNIPFLIDQLNETFPNAEKHVIKAIVDDEYFYGDEDQEEIKMMEDTISSYYDIFRDNGVDVVGDYDSVDSTLGFSNNKIQQIRNEIQKSLFQNVVDDEVSTEPLVTDEPFSISDNIDISGDDETDFDSIYEFLERFEEIVNSKNSYDSRVSTSFKPDIEQIQIALNFLNPSFPFEITGKYDVDTEEAVYEYQLKNNLTETGLCDNETLEEILYDLKAKSFDEEDLGKYLQEILGIEKILKKEIKKFKAN